MSEFEKWWNRQGKGIHKLSISMQQPGGKSKEEMCKLAWVAALMIVKDWGCGRRFNEEDLMIMLHKELEDNE